MALATIVFEGAGTGNNAAGATTLVVNVPTGTVENELLFAAITVRGTTTTATNASWTEFRSQSDGANSITRYYWRRASASEPTSYTFSLGTSQKASGVIAAFSGVDVLAPIEAQNSQANASSTTITAPTITTLTNGAMLVFVGGTAIGTTAAAPSTWNTAGSDASTGGNANTRTTTGIAYLTKATAGATGNITATYGAAATNAGGLFALEPRTFTTVSGTFTADSVLRRTYSSTFTANAVLRRTYSSTLTADAELEFNPEQSLTKFASTFSSNSGFVNPTNAYADDGVYATDTPARATTDSIYYGTAPFTVAEVPNGSTINSVTWEIQYKSSVTNSTGSTIAFTPYYVTSGGAFQTQESAAVFGQTLTDTVVTDSGLYSLAMLRQTVGGTTYGPQLLVQPSRAANNTAITWSIDYIKVTVKFVPPNISTVEGSVTADAVFKAKQTETFTANALIEKTFASSITANAVIERIYTVTLTANSILKAKVTATATGDAVMRKTFSSTATANAVIEKTFSGSFTGTSLIKSAISGSFTGDSLLKRTYSATVTGDAFIRRTFASTLTATALLRKTLSSEYTADAVLSQTLSDSFTASAVLLRTVTTTFIADAVVGNVPPPVWGMPAGGTDIGSTPTFYFVIPNYGTKRIFFHLQLDTSDTFDSVNLRNYRSNTSTAGWEYWDGTDWVTAPSDGIDNIYRTNEARFTPPTPLGAGTWYRRIRSGI